jgi:hypothetical protein
MSTINGQAGFMEFRPAMGASANSVYSALSPSMNGRVLK